MKSKDRKSKINLGMTRATGQTNRPAGPHWVTPAHTKQKGFDQEEVCFRYWAVRPFIPGGCRTQHCPLVVLQETGNRCVGLDFLSFDTLHPLDMGSVKIGVSLGAHRERGGTGGEGDMKMAPHT